ncbi:hypothetical protein M427DRAFT_176677 [Gonapodya prolifera JEL478]|uniref:Uncharacterized protein n=1 Tax=Gonapodya prolifera (strain JEL478) TaxID=1344416 RepID=A0A139AQ78_GONPJ|nr:hypothetical protein M427DRAFT_176677 [Gonapodya prolifera JEL478]|eukprot:KXS18814.1 hypothetical protein M427DRAFT_176677 [Gonapodya prolifera JEL478]
MALKNLKDRDVASVLRPPRKPESIRLAYDALCKAVDKNELEVRVGRGLRGRPTKERWARSALEEFEGRPFEKDGKQKRHREEDSLSDGEAGPGNGKKQKMLLPA